MRRLMRERIEFRTASRFTRFFLLGRSNRTVMQGPNSKASIFTSDREVIQPPYRSSLLVLLSLAVLCGGCSTAGSYTGGNNKTTPTITWTTPSAITYGTALSATQLNATASVAGSFAYTPPASTILNSGTQTLSVTFTPTDTTNYTTATHT
ncbi:MAG: hypothetical protein WBR10_05265, partial [Candidatus Acidiferrum sp.]